MPKTPKTVREYSKKAAESFIQTAVFIDDRIYQQHRANAPTMGPLGSPQPRPRVTDTVNRANNDAIGAAGDTPEDETESNIYDIVSSFAKKGVVCSMYEPKGTSLDHEMNSIVPLCTAADIVVIDWNLHGNRGLAAIDLIKKLINRAIREVPEQIRLIMVYTQEIDLSGVADETFESINSDIDDSFQLSKEENGLAFHNKNS